MSHEMVLTGLLNEPLKQQIKFVFYKTCQFSTSEKRNPISWIYLSYRDSIIMNNCRLQEKLKTNSAYNFHSYVHFN